MSSHKVTLNELILKWTDITTQSSTTRWDEMQAFFAEAAEAEISPQEMMKAKNRIVKVWCPLTWEEAKAAPYNWREKPWWADRKKGTLRTFDKWYADHVKAWKEANQVVEPARKPTLKVVGSSEMTQAEEEYYGRFEIFTTAEQAIAHRKTMDEREKNGSSK